MTDEASRLRTWIVALRGAYVTVLWRCKSQVRVSTATVLICVRKALV